MRGRRLDRRDALRVAALVVAASLVLPGAVFGASLTVQKGNNEEGRGLFVVAQDVGTWWIAERFSVMQIPATVPHLASATAGTPTVMANTSTSWVLANTTAGAAAVVWYFGLTKLAPHNTEIEIKVNVSIAAGPPLRFTVFLETNASASSTTVTMRLFIATSGVTPVQTDVESSTVRAAACTAVGSCP